MVQSYILASISNVLQYQIQDVELAWNIMLSLKEMFGEQGCSTRQETMRQIYNTKMTYGTLVKEHSLRMISNPEYTGSFRCRYWWRIPSGYDTPVTTRIIQGIQT